MISNIVQRSMGYGKRGMTDVKVRVITICVSLFMVVAMIAAYMMWTATSGTSSLSLVAKQSTSEKGRKQQPNIIFLLADDLGYNDIGYHNPAMRTANIDAMSADGIRLENYYVQPLCSPTRSQLLSGRYQIHTGLQHSLIWVAQPLCHPLTDPTMADKLRETGYATHAVGKWHMGYYRKECWPTNRGFDSFFGFLTGSGDYYTHNHNGGNPGLSGSQGWGGQDLRDNLRQVAGDYQGVYSIHLFTQKSQEIIRQHDQSKAVHFPLQVPPEYYEDLDDIPPGSRRVYAGMVRCMDEAVGNITNTLKETGMWNNTILVFSSDNGGAFNHGGNNWPFKGKKGTLWEGGIKGVGFVASPLLPKSVRGTVNEDLLHVTDWFPTLVKGVAKGKMKGTQPDGYNVWKNLASKRRRRDRMEWPRKEILHNLDPYSPYFSELPKRFTSGIPAAIRYENWKLVTSQGGENGSWVAAPESADRTRHPDDSPRKQVWLFDLATDPTEKNDLWESRKDIADSLLRRLGSYLRESVPVNFPRPDLQGNPALHNNSWSDWITDDEMENV